MNKQETILTLVRQAGAANAAPVPQSGILYDRMFRDICRGNACGRYGTCYMCPPDVGDIGELIARAKEYPFGVLYQSIGQLEDSFDFEGMTEAGKAHHACSQRIRQALEDARLGGCLHLTSGGCGVCERCAKPDGLPCRFPDKALPSLESYGVNVYATAQNAGLKYTNGTNTVTYFGLVLFKE